MAFAFLQDTVLEPFAGQVFGMEARITNRFAAYWGSMAILGSFASLFLLRRLARLQPQQYVAAWRLGSHSCVPGVCRLVADANPSAGDARLVALGIGLGVWNIGTLGLMMDLSPAGPRRHLPRLLDAMRHASPAAEASPAAASSAI